MRKVLNSTLNVQNLDEEGLHTVLCEVEAIINGRPITKAVVANPSIAIDWSIFETFPVDLEGTARLM